MKYNLGRDTPEEYFAVGLVDVPEDPKDWLRVDKLLHPAGWSNAWSTKEEADRELKVQKLRMGQIQVEVFFYWRESVGKVKFLRKRA